MRRRWERVTGDGHAGRGLEELLGLVERLQRRIHDIERTVGLDASVMGEMIHPKSLEDLRRIRQGDRKVQEELDQAAELTSTEEMKLPLLRFIANVGEDAIREIPMGIHSGKEAPVKGVFFAFRARDRHFWRLYPVEGDAAIADKRKIFRWIECTASEPRCVPSPEPSVFPLLERATEDILNDIRAQRGTARIRVPLTGINKRLYDILNSRDVWELMEEDMRNRLNHVLETVPLRHLERGPTT